MFPAQAQPAAPQARFTRVFAGTRYGEPCAADPGSSFEDTSLAACEGSRKKSKQNSLSRILDPAVFDDLSPLFVFGFKERAERIRRAADRHRADIEQFLVDGRIGKRVVDRLVQLRDERGWSFRRRQ